MDDQPPLVVKLAEATREQLFAFANKVKGLNVAPSTSNKDIKAKIERVHHQETIEIPAAVAATLQAGKAAGAKAPAGTPPRDPDAKAPKAKGGKLPEPTVWLTVMATKEPGGDRPEFVSGGKGKGMLLPRGEAIEVPYRYFETMKNARQRNYKQSKDEQGNLISGQEDMTETYALPFQVNEMPPREQLKAWLEQQGGRWEPELDKFYETTFSERKMRSAAA